MGAEDALRYLIQFANTIVPRSYRSDTPMILKATAGMRSIPAMEAEVMMHTVQHILHTSGYAFHNHQASIIEGREEAGLAWVTANYLSGTFNVTKDEVVSTGVIELGGGSMQVSFILNDKEGVSVNDTFLFTTSSGMLYRLYAHSYLGYGQDYAQQRLRDTLGNVSEDPCYPRGYWRKSAQGAIVVGSGGASRCQALIQANLLSSSNAPGRYRGERPLRGPFLATESFYYEQADLHFPLQPQDSYSGVMMNYSAEAACNKFFAGVSDDPNKPNHCFALSYQASVLSALKAPHAQITAAKRIHGNAVNWPLGAALVFAIQSREVINDFDPLFSEACWYALMVATMVCVVGCYAGGVCRKCHKRKWRRWNYVPFGAPVGASLDEINESD